MVSRLLYAAVWPFFLLSSFHAASAQIEATIDEATHFENQPIEGTLAITHSPDEAIDPSTFSIDGQPLTASFLQNDLVRSDSQQTAVSLYRFTLPGQPKGLYVLPAMTAKVGNQILKTTPSTYEVHSQSTPADTAQSSQTSFNTQARSATKTQSPVIFRLEAQVDGPSTLYPGQRTELFYRISYNRSIDLTASVLPFIHATAFKKVGDARIKDYQNGEVTVQEIVQEVEASQTGSFPLGPSKIAGYPYHLNMFGKKVYQEPLLQATAPAVQVEVKPFPTEGQPGSFNGALGQIQVTLNMLNPPSLRLEDKIELEMRATGVSNLAELRLPDFHCQPGFSGFFQFSDLPPAGEIKNEARLFRIELNPVSTFVQAIPSFELSSFDPATNRYIIQKTTPIPLTLQSPPLADFPPQALTVPSGHLNEKLLWHPADWPLTPLEIKGSPLLGTHLTQKWVQTPWVLLILPFSCGWLWLQWHLKQQMDKRPRPLKKRSDQLLNRVMEDRKLPARQAAQLIENASWWKIWEEGILAPKQKSLECLPKQGPLGEIRAFIIYLQSLQYSPNQDFAIKDVLHRAQRLFSTKL